MSDRAESLAGGEADELALVQQAVRGDVSAFERIMRRYNQRLFRLAVSIVGDAAEAEDVLQDSYVRAYYRLESFAGRSGLGSWLARIVRNQAIDHLRAREARGQLLALESDLTGSGYTDADDIRMPLEIESVHADPENAVAGEELQRLLESAVKALPVPFRSVFMLREIEGLSVQETAEYLDIPPATVKTRDHRARLLLREYLSRRIDATAQKAFPFLGSSCDRLVARVLDRLAADSRRP
ncbi:MAG: RNA polymerase sigma factor [Pseudomonadota bacterium]|jgi:RNA polymerase sigma factor, sigma-70 family